MSVCEGEDEYVSPVCCSQQTPCPCACNEVLFVAAVNQQHGWIIVVVCAVCRHVDYVG